MSRLREGIAPEWLCEIFMPPDRLQPFNPSEVLKGNAWLAFNLRAAVLSAASAGRPNVLFIVFDDLEKVRPFPGGHFPDRIVTLRSGEAFLGRANVSAFLIPGPWPHPCPFCLAMLLLAAATSARGTESTPAKNGRLLFQDDFDRTDAVAGHEDIGRGWTSNTAIRAKGHQQVLNTSSQTNYGDCN